MKKLFIIQSNYIPWKGYFDALKSVDEVIIHDDRQYTKNDWRNRNKIKTPNGMKWLTIPVNTKSSLQKIEEIQIADPKWNKDHWNILEANYSKAAHYKTYKEFFKELYLNRKETYLSEINLAFIKAINTLLDIKTPIVMSRDFNASDDDRNQRLIDFCKLTNTTDYYSGPSAKNYIDEKMFADNGIGLHWLDYSDYPHYTQLYGDFTHEVSIIDLFFNEGPNAHKFLKCF